jgi:hypothetical protein
LIILLNRQGAKSAKELILKYTTILMFVFLSRGISSCAWIYVIVFGFWLLLGFIFFDSFWWLALGKYCGALFVCAITDSYTPYPTSCTFTQKNLEE